MKQFIFLVAMTAYFSVRSIVDPFWAVLLYYGLSVLRPQAVWEWALKNATSQQIRWSLIAAIVAILSFLINFSACRHRIVQKRFILLLTLFGLCLAGSYYYAKNHQIAELYGWEYAKLFIMLILSCFVITRKWHVRYLAWMIFLSLTYLVYEINFTYVFQHRLDIVRNGYGGLDNNGAALMLAMVIPFCYYFFQAERRWWRWILLVCALPAIHAVMLTYSRGAMLSTLVAGTGMLYGMARRKFVQTACLVVVLGMIVLTLAGPEVRNRFFSVKENIPGSSRELRFASWRAGWKIALDYPIFGVGLRNSNLLTKAYGADMEGRTIHNIYIQIAADAGIPAAIIFTTLIVMTLWHLREAARRSQSSLDDPEMRWHHYVCLASFWSMVIFAFGSIFLSFETFELCYLLMLMGAVAPTLSQQIPETQVETARAAVVEKLSTAGSRKIRGVPA
ncbi:MAG: O-antigen ligase family protein [Phycisphaerae bacterium]